jgi:nucleoside-diphosphate-sugar epimerase
MSLDTNKWYTVTGSSGFVGRNLMEYLSIHTSFTVHTLKLSQQTTDSLDFKGDVVIHLAGKAHDLNKVLNPEEYYSVNFELTKKVYLNFLASSARKFIFISSVKASADQVKDILYENDAPNPKTHYGKSKLMAEEFIQSMPLPDGKSYYILRPCMIHGPGNKGNLSLLYKLISKGFPYPLAAFENKRSFLSVDNFSFVIKELMERDDILSGIYNVADNEALSTNDVVLILAESQNKKAMIWKVFKGFIQSLAKIGDVLRLPLTTERLQKLTENYVVNNNKIKSALGKPLPISAKEGLIKTFKSYKSKNI